MNQNDRVAVIVVTYNRKRLLERCLRALQSQTVPLSRICVVDNASTDDTQVFMEQQTAEYLRLSENLGGAGGFRRGFAWALAASDWDWLLVMDDDAAPAPDYVETLLGQAVAFPDVKCLIGTEYVGDTDRIAYGGRRIIDRQRTVRTVLVPKEQYEKPYFYVDTMTFVGPMLHRSVVEAVGCPDDSFFIYYDDTDYCLRLRPYTKILQVVSARIVHREDYEKDVVTEGSQPWRQYYLCRNELVIKLRYIKNPLIRYGWAAKNYLRQVIEILRTEQQRGPRLRLVTRATADALLHRLGKAEGMRPQKERILFSIMGFLPGGAEILPIRLANYLHDAGYVVGVHCVQESADHAMRSLLHPDIPVYATDRFWRMAQILHREHYTVVHSHCVASQLLVARMKRRLPFFKIRHVATSHGGYEGMPPQEAAALLPQVDRGVDAWTYVAQNNLPLLRQAGVPNAKLHKIGNAMEPPRQIEPVSWTDYGIAKDAFVFTVITRAVAKKSWPACIAAIREARQLSGRDIHLVLGGIGPIYDALLQEPAEPFIHLLGEIQRPCDYYKASYCGLLLSVLECAPLGILEMYEAGIPVVATDTGDVAEMLQGKDGQTGILVPLTEDGQVPISQAARAICDMVLDSERYESCKERTAQKVSEFRMDHIAEQYLALYGRQPAALPGSEKEGK